MSAYDMNTNNDDVFYVKILNRKNEINNAKYPTFRLREFAKNNNIIEILDILGDVDIYFDLNDDKKISGIEVVTFYDEDLDQ